MTLTVVVATARARRRRFLSRLCALTVCAASLIAVGAAHAYQVLASAPQASSSTSACFGTEHVLSQSLVFRYADAFSPSVTGRVSHAIVVLNHNGAGSLTASLWTLPGGENPDFSSQTGIAPAQELASGISAYPPGTAVASPVTLAAAPLLQAGQEYALVVSNDNGWCASSTVGVGFGAGQYPLEYDNGLWLHEPPSFGQRGYGFPFTVYGPGQVPPSCPGDTLAVAFNGTATLDPSCSGTGLTYTVASGPAYGTLSAPGANGEVTYTPNHDASGSDTFTLTATDSQGQTTTDPVTVTIAKPPAPSCAGDSGSVAFNTPGTLTFSCTGTELSYAVASGPAHGTLDPISGNTVLYSPHDGYHGGDSFLVTATDPTGQSASDQVTVTVAGPGNVVRDGDDQFTDETAETQFSLPPQAQQTASVTCPSGEFAADGHALVQTVDQGTGTPADIQILAQWASSRDTYEFVLYNPDAGQAQGHLYASCVGLTTFKGHALTVSDPITRDVNLTAGQTATTIDCPDGTTAVTPGYETMSGLLGPSAAVLTTSGPNAGGSAWRFAFYAVQPETVEVSVSCLRYATDNGSLVLGQTVSTTASADGSGTPSSTQVGCPVDTIGALIGYSVPSSVALLGDEPQGRATLIWLEGLGGTGGSAQVTVECLGLTTATTSDPVPGSAGHSRSQSRTTATRRRDRAGHRRTVG